MNSNRKKGIFIESISIIPGMRFGMLLVLEENSFRDKSKCKYYKCQCDCGNIKIISRMALVTKDTKSCGCFKIKSKQLNPGEASWNVLFYTCVRSAKQRCIPFEINKEKFKEISSKNCYYCGQCPASWNRYSDSNGINIKKVTKETFERAFIFVNGIDRVNNNLGYTINNSVSCCKNCNEMKMDRTKEEFLNHINKIHNFQDSYEG